MPTLNKESEVVHEEVNKTIAKGKNPMFENILLLY